MINWGNISFGLIIYVVFKLHNTRIAFDTPESTNKSNFSVYIFSIFGIFLIVTGDGDCDACVNVAKKTNPILCNLSTTYNNTLHKILGCLNGILIDYESF